ncbi:MAG: hypothetical protein AAB363_02360, partial [Planctomycetota bacterium]
RSKKSGWIKSGWVDPGNETKESASARKAGALWMKEFLFSKAVSAVFSTRPSFFEGQSAACSLMRVGYPQ